MHISVQKVLYKTVSVDNDVQITVASGIGPSSIRCVARPNVTTDAIAGSALRKGPDRDTSHRSASPSLAFAKLEKDAC